mmetsp:Transcript_6067/g.8358  ORF Transcript_6067/g.8358 Transcript_6067/m.8358 type:complete len:1165 (-) Transcript_6067:2307-5801(-)
MKLFNFTIIRSKQYKGIVKGVFLNQDKNTTVLYLPNLIDLYKINSIFSMHLVSSTFIFGIIRQIRALKFLNQNQDYLIICSGSGSFSIYKFNLNTGWIRISNHFLGRSGCRRMTPGYYLECDLIGRICMICSLDKLRYVYILNKNQKNNNISIFPIEVHKSNSLITSLKCLYNGFKNPVFATIELDKKNNNSNTSQNNEISQYIVFYEFDLGLGLLVTSYIDKIPLYFNTIIPLINNIAIRPACLVLSSSYITMKTKYQIESSVNFPSRIGCLNKGIFSGYTYFIQNKNNNILYYIQNSIGDIFVVQIIHKQLWQFSMSIEYIDTTNPALDFLMISSDTFFALSENNNFHYIYKLQNTNREKKISISKNFSTINYSNIFLPCFFIHKNFCNLSIINKIEILANVSSLTIKKFENDTMSQEIYLTSSAGLNSFLHILEYGIGVLEIATANLPSEPISIWSIHSYYNIKNKFLIAISFETHTYSAFFRFDEKNSSIFEESHKTGLQESINTIYCNILNETSIIQVFKEGIFWISKQNIISRWNIPRESEIIMATSNFSQLFVVLKNTWIMYFEHDTNDNLYLTSSHHLGKNIIDINIITLFEKHVKSQEILVCTESNILILSIHQNNLFRIIINYKLPTIPYRSKCLNIKKGFIDIFVSIKSGLLLNLSVELYKYIIKTPKMRFIGNSSPNLTISKYGYKNILVIFSDKTFILHFNENRTYYKPLVYKNLKYASTLQISGLTILCGITRKSFNLLILQELDNIFRRTKIALVTSSLSTSLLKYFSKILILSSENYNGVLGKNIGEIDNNKKNYRYKYLQQSRIQVVDTKKKIIYKTFNYPNQETLVSLKLINFYIRRSAFLLFVMLTRAVSKNNGFLYLVYCTSKNFSWIPLHRSFLNFKPYCIEVFKNRVIIGGTDKIVLFRIGRKKILKHCEFSLYFLIPSKIILHSNRIVISDFLEGLIVTEYNINLDAMIVVGYSVYGRSLNNIQFLDYDTVLGTDYFGNILIFRIPQLITFKSLLDPRKYQDLNHSYINKSDPIHVECSFFIGENITGISKYRFFEWKEEIIIYFTNLGSIGILIPIKTKFEKVFFRNLFYHLTLGSNNFLSLSNFKFRSSNYISSRIIDGDFCSKILEFNKSTQLKIARAIRIKITSMTKIFEDLLFKIM